MNVPPAGGRCSFLQQISGKPPPSPIVCHDCPFGAAHSALGEVTAIEQETLGLLVGMHRIVRHLRRIGSSSTLHPTQFIALLLIGDEQPVRIGTIATRLPCSQPTATTTVAALEAAGLARRQPDLLDGRATAVVLTPEGDAVVKAAGRHAVGVS